MAEGLPSYILDTVLKQLESPLFQSCNKKLNFSLLHTQLGDLRSKLELIREVIGEAEWMGVLFPKIVGDWVCELQCVLHEVDDLLDEALTRSIPASDMVEKVRLQLANMPFGLTLAHKMKKLNKRLDRIVEKCYECNLFVVDSSHQSQPPRKPVARKGILRYDPDDHVKDDEELQMIGRDNDKKQLIEMLRGGDSTNPSFFFYGEPGVGKTTLGRAVFNDVQVKDWFEIRLWFNYADGSEGDLCKKILSELGADEEASINNKRFLLVLDNSDWVYYNFDWFRKLHAILDSSHRGSKILGIGSGQFAENCYHHRLRNLSEDDSRSIFNKTGPVVIGDDRHDLREKIVSKCMGNPALLKAVGTLLYGNGDMTKKWEYLAHNFDTSVRYDHYAAISKLNSRLPRCVWSVGYLSIFLNGEFKKSSLIHHFAAHGFTNLPSYDLLAERYFTSLTKASSKDNWDVEDNFTVTDSIINRDSISQIAGRESTTARCTEAVIDEAARHVSIVRPSSPMVQRTHEIMLPDGSIKDITHRRTLLFLGDLPIRMSIQSLDMLASNLQYLRVLDLHDLALQTLPSSIGNLIHLRYLDLSRNEFKMLPNSIHKLKNLQTLKLFYCDKLIKLPRRIDILGHLKNLEINMCLDLTLMPSTIARLTRLENLDRFVVNPHKGGLRYLEHLNNLNGDLAIELPRRWKASATEAEQAKLEEKKGLTTLRFRWPSFDNGGDSSDGDDNDVVLDKLKPWGGIEYLSIVNFGGTKIPSWVTSLGVVESSCLTEIFISRCKRCTKLPSFHRMPKLRVLTLTSIMNIEYLQDNSSNSDVSVFFPSLKELKIGEMPNLKGWSKDLGGLPKFPGIYDLSIWCCRRLTIMPPFTRIWKSVTLQAVSEELIQLIDWLGGAQIRKVSIISIPDMVVLPGEFVNKLPEELTITDCKQLQMLWTDEVQGEEAHKSMLRLYRLCISNAPALKHMRSSLQQLSSLKTLEISGCDEELDCLYNKDEDGMPWEALTRLLYLEIKDFQKLVSLPEGFRCLRRLKELTIENCKALKLEAGSLPPNLMKLCIKSCPLLISRCVEELDCLYNKDEDGMPSEALTLLFHWKLKCLQKSESLRKGFCWLHSLEKITVGNCKALKWEVGNLPPNLKKLCEDIKREHPCLGLRD